MVSSINLDWNNFSNLNQFSVFSNLNNILNLLYESIVKYYYVHVHIFCFNQEKLMKRLERRKQN